MRAARIDVNQTGVIKELRQMGYSVKPTHMVGAGFPDIVVGYGGRNFLFEIKDPAKPASGRKLTKPEEEFHAAWRGQVDVILSSADAHMIIALAFRNAK